MSELPVEHLNATLEPLYSEIQAELPFRFSADSPIWAQPLCSLWSRTALPILQDEFAGSGIVFEHIACHPTIAAQKRHELEYAFHHYIKASGESIPTHVIDGTYLQFAHRTARVAMPHVLIAPAERTADILEQAYIDPASFFIWRPDKYDAGVFHDPKKVNRIFASPKPKRTSEEVRFVT